MSPTRHDVQIAAGGERLAAWHYPGEGDALATGAGRPCAVMAHGFGATRDCGLEPFAEALAAEGADVLLFDYRHFGASTGEPRGLISPSAQRADYAAAIAHARTLAGVDPAAIIAWGVSFAGGHVLQVAAEDPRIAAVIAMTPSVDGGAATQVAVRRDGLAQTGRLMRAGFADLVAGRRGGAPVTIPAVGAPGTTAVMTAPGAADAWAGIAGPTWQPHLCARILVGFGLYRPGRHAASITVPLLVQVADNDQTAPPGAAMKAAVRGRAEVRHLPCDHFDVYPGGSAHALAVRQQVEFLRRRFGSGARDAAEVTAGTTA